MKSITTCALLTVAVATSACVTQPLAQKKESVGIDTSGWSCSARGMVIGRYGGGDSAYVQLLGDKQGGDYPVRLNQQGTVATGLTGSSVPFTCTKR